MEVVNLTFCETELCGDVLNGHTVTLLHLENLRDERILLVHHLADFLILHLGLKLLYHPGVATSFITEFKHLLVTNLICLMLVTVFRIRTLPAAVAFRAADQRLQRARNVAYIMAWHADPSIPGTIDEWLEDFEMFSIYEILPEILELWGDNLMTQVDVKKNRQRAVGK